MRIDSGDLASLAQRVRNQLDALGATNTKITVTNDLDEYALAALQTAPVDSYGVGTMLVTGSGAPTCAMVYKLTERENSAGEMQPVAKKSKDKATVPGRKLAFRSYEYSLADCEHVISGSEDKLAAYQPEDGWKDLLGDYRTVVCHQWREPQRIPGPRRDRQRAQLPRAGARRTADRRAEPDEGRSGHPDRSHRAVTSVMA